MKNSISWVLWLIMSIVLILFTRNPLYLIIILICLFLLGARIAKQKNQSFWLIQNIRFLLTMLLISSLINMLFTHIGQTTLFLIPESWFLIGGNITLESLVYGLINGMIIGTIYLTFNILNLSLSVRQLTHLIPVALRPLAMTVTITLTFFPSIQQRAREIKEAQMIRGNQMKKIRDWLPLLLPLLISSLENAVQLSESMTSRGFETQPDVKNTKLTLVSLIISTFSVFSAWILSLYDYPVYITLPLYIFGGMIIFVTFISASKKSSITHYRKEVWTKKDVFASGIFLLSLIGLVILLQFGRLSFFSYSPYPTLHFPDFSIAGILLSVVPLLPIFLGKND